MALCLTIRFDETIKIGDTELTFEKYSGSQIRVKIKAPKDVQIHREKAKNGHYENTYLDKIPVFKKPKR